MFCWQARRGFAEKLEGIAGLAGSPLDRHLSGCAGCSAELEGLRQLRSLLLESARTSTLSTEAAAFEERVLRLARSRAAREQTHGVQTHRDGGDEPGRAPFRPPSSPLSPLSRCPSLRLFRSWWRPSYSLISSAALSSAVLSRPAPRCPLPPPSHHKRPRQTISDDRIVAPQEVPLSSRKISLERVAVRIPLTTYVLEPAPDEQGAPSHAGTGAGKPVMRASL